MTRVRLRDDFRGYPRVRVRLDDDSYPSAVPTRLDDDCADCGGGELPADSIYPLLTIRERFSSGFDEDGNPMWMWADVVKDKSMISFETRTEKDDRAGITEVVADMVFLYPFSEPLIRESATVRTSDGYGWRITKIVRFPDRLQVTGNRIDDGE